MTIAELRRYFESKKRVTERKAREKASYDYILGDLIGKSIARIYNKNAKYPEIFEAYPTLFESEEIQEKRREQQMELSALRFKQFANFHNKNLGGGKKN